MALALTVPAFADKIDVSGMPKHRILSYLPDTLHIIRPATAEQLDYERFSSASSHSEWILSENKEDVFGEIADLTDRLTAGKTTDTEKIKAIFDWVSQNITYGDAGYKGDLYRNPLYVYARKSAVCEGYALLCQIMGTIAEIPVVYIAGGAAGNGAGHAWNAALADGKWVFFDATWSEWDMAPDYHDTSGQLFFFDGIFQINAHFIGKYDLITAEMELRSGFTCPANVTVPDYVTEVNLPNNPGLTSITLPDSVTTVNLSKCTGLTSITIPGSVSSIGDSAFSGCTALKSVTILRGTTSIGGAAFAGCTGLTDVSLPAGLTSIGAWAFNSCTGLTSVTIPSTVTSIGTQAFIGCIGLTSITIPNGVTAIEDSTFYGCTGLTSITIPSGVTKIGDSAFQSCSSLTDVTIPNTVTVIERQAFWECYGLTSITIPDSVTSIEPMAFYGCAGLKDVNIPDHLAEMWKQAFNIGTGMPSVVIPAGTTSIEDNAYSSWSSLERVTIPDSVTSIGNWAFANCVNLTDVTIPNRVTTIGNNAFANCDKLTALTIPNSVTTIGNYAFSSCDGLTSMVVPEGVTSIGEGIFMGCTGLTSVTIPSSVTVIKRYGFKNCTNLESIAIPASVTSIEKEGFNRCTSLKDVYYAGTEEQWKAISIEKYNDALTSATIHYNSAAPKPAEPETPVAYPNTQMVTIDGKKVEFQLYSLKDEKGNDTNYIKLRDLALAFKGTAAQFDVGQVKGVVTFTRGGDYTPNGTEHNTPYSGVQPYKKGTADVNINGTLTPVELLQISHSTGGYTYFQVKDIAQKLNVNVYWKGGIVIETDKPYTGK